MRLEQQTEVKRFISFFTRGFNYCVTAKVLEIHERRRRKSLCENGCLTRFKRFWIPSQLGKRPIEGNFLMTYLKTLWLGILNKSLIILYSLISVFQEICSQWQLKLLNQSFWRVRKIQGLCSHVHLLINFSWMIIIL